MNDQIKAGMIRFSLITDDLNDLFVRLVNAPAAPRGEHQDVPSGPGIYLFSEGERPLYVGQTRTLRRRLRQHTIPSADHNQACFAFLIAREGGRRHGLKIDGTRKALAADPAFAALFVEAKKRVSSMDVRFILLEDPHTRTIFEVYASMLLGTAFNSFETH